MQCPRHLHSKGYKGTGLSRSLNSCRTSKRGIADKPQCPSNSFRLQILIAFTIESGKSSAYFILIMLIFYWNKSFFINAPYWASTSKFVLQERLERRRKCQALSASCPFPRPPEIRFTQIKSHLLVHSKIHPTIFHVLILLSLNVPKIKTRKLLLVGNVEGSVEDSS